MADEPPEDQEHEEGEEGQEVRPYVRRRSTNRTWPRMEREPNGIWYGYFFDPVRGKKRIVSLGTRNEDEAYERFVQARKGVAAFKKRPEYESFKSVAEKFLVYLDTADHLSPETIRRYKLGIANALPYFAKCSIHAVTRRMIKNFKNDRKAKVTVNSARNDVAAVSALFNWLVDSEIVSANVTRGIWKKGEVRVARPHYVPSVDEIRRIREVLALEARPIFDALVSTGCRLGEIQRANVGDVNFEYDFLRVIRKGGKQDYVPLNPVLLRAIRESLAARPNARPEDPLFVNRHGKRYLRITRSLATACRRAGVPRCTHHSLRHFYGTYLREMGKGYDAIADLMGHTSPKITKAIYVHKKGAEALAAAQELGQKLEKSWNSQKVAKFERRKKR